MATYDVSVVVLAAWNVQAGVSQHVLSGWNTGQGIQGNLTQLADVAWISTYPS